LTWEERAADGRPAWTLAQTPTREALGFVLDTIQPVHAHIHNMMRIPQALIELLVWRGVSYDWTMHDYYSICPRAHLECGDGRYCGEPEPPACNACIARHGDYQGNPVDGTIQAWRERFVAHLRGARRIFVPSDDVRLRLARYAPGLPVAVCPHPVITPDSGRVVAVFHPGERARVVVPGTIVAFKGSTVLLDCALDAARQKHPLEFIVLGRTDRDAALRRTGRVRITGPYQEHEFFARLAALQCHLAFLPSLVPETYMYTLSLVMASGLFAICFDLGAQAERVRAWGGGLVLPLNSSPAAINRALLELAASQSARSVPPPPERFWAGSTDLVDSYYGFTETERRRFRRRP
jgi:hypothetical protein